MSLTDIIMTDDKHTFEEALKLVSPEIINNNIKPLLHGAIRSNNIECIKLLLKYKADVNLRDTSDWTPLHTAVLYDNIRAMDILLKNGADISSETNGRLPIEIYTSEREILFMLIDYDSPLPFSSYKGDNEELKLKLQIINTHPKIKFGKLMDILFKHKLHPFFNIENRDVISKIKKYLNMSVDEIKNEK